MAFSALVLEARLVFGACFLISRASPAPVPDVPSSTRGSTTSSLKVMLLSLTLGALDLESGSMHHAALAPVVHCWRLACSAGSCRPGCTPPGLRQLACLAPPISSHVDRLPAYTLCWPPVVSGLLGPGSLTAWPVLHGWPDLLHAISRSSCGPSGCVPPPVRP
jgi:hypothetical protein